MQCETCGYELFNLTVPRCPECNTPFDVTRYTFPPGSVRFACPHCDQLYQGNDARGLPHPRLFRCAKCRQEVYAGHMRVVPVTEAAMRAGGVGLPWEAIEGRGLFRSWWDTCKLGMFHPTDYYRRLHYADDLPRAMGFAFICAIVNTILGGVSFVVGAALGVSPVSLLATLYPAGLSPCDAVALIIAAVLAQTAGPFVAAAAIHIGVMVYAEVRGTYTNTVVVLAYAMCPAVWSSVPVFGRTITLLWCLAVSAVGIAVIHSMKPWQVAAAYAVSGLILMFVFFPLGMFLWGVLH